jgi:hypothetical protein
MALSALCQLEVRSGGSSTGGGGFVEGASGVDYSLQDAPQYSVTDGVTAGTAVITSATAAFGTDVVGNLVYVQGGTGSVTAGWYQILTRNSATSITVDRSTGLTAGTGVTLHIGGAFSGLALALAITVAGMRIWVKATAGYTTAATITQAVNAGDGTAVSIEGYTTTRGDGGMATITSTNAAATSVLNVTGQSCIVRNIKADGANLSLRGISGAAAYLLLENCWATRATLTGIRCLASQALVRRCLATANGTAAGHAGFSADTGTAVFDRCVARANGGSGFASLTAGVANCVNCIASGNTLSGFESNVSQSVMRLFGCTSYGNTLDGLRFAAVNTFLGSYARNSIFYGNSGYGIRSITTDYGAFANLATVLENNAFGGNTLGARFQVPTGEDDITLTADPFLDASADDFGLNLILGGGLSLRGAGVPGSSGFGLRSSPEPSDASTDVGAVQTAGVAVTGSSIATMRQMWRKFTGEVYDVVSDAEIDEVWIQRGLEDLNRAVRYHYTDDTLTLVAGQQEYSAPADCNEILHIYLNGQLLVKSSIQEWRRNKIPWRQASGDPQEWAFYGGTIVFYPTPNAAAIATDDNPDIRYVSNPRAFSTYGAEQLRAQDLAIPVYRAVALWSASYPDSAAAQLRIQKYDALFDAEAAKVAAYYEARGLLS